LSIFFTEISASIFTKSGPLGRPVGVMLSVLQPARTVAVATMATDRARTDGRFSNFAESKYYNFPGRLGTQVLVTAMNYGPQPAAA
jgi:hypothetical protein